MFKTNITDARAAHERKKRSFFVNLAAKLNGAEERKALAQSKRERKAAKRAADAFNSGVGHLQARERLA